jgi:hypothetical protein
MGRRIFDELGRGKSEPGERIVPNSGQILSRLILRRGQTSGPKLQENSGDGPLSSVDRRSPNRVLTGHRQLASVQTANDNRQFTQAARQQVASL